MRRLIYLVIACLIIVSCKEETKNYTTFSGKIINKNSDSLVVVNLKTSDRKVVKVNETGTFIDTLMIETGFHTISDGNGGAMAFLKKGSEIEMTFDAKDLRKTLIFKGKGVNESNFLAKSSLLQDELLETNGDLFQLPKEKFEAELKSYEESFEKRLVEKTLDTAFIADQRKRIKSNKQYILGHYESVKRINDKLPKNAVSPKFVNYENHKGGTTSLDDFKGKYVYIDVWATWCQPCKNEIPYLKKVHEKFSDKNIEFVGISVDKAKDQEVWRKMVTDMELKGTQLFANNAWSSEFVKSYQVNGIPRFILIDPKGNIVDPRAPRPSSGRLMKLLESLDI